LANWIKKEDLTICGLQEIHLVDRNKHWLRVKGWKKIYQADAPPKQARVVILISDKVDFKFKLLKTDKESHFVLIKGEIHEEEITIINLYVPNVSASNLIKHTQEHLKLHIDPKTVVVRNFNTPLSIIDRSSEKNQKINPRTK
jgi:exonuclease III